MYIIPVYSSVKQIYTYKIIAICYPEYNLNKVLFKVYVSNLLNICG